MQVFARVPDLQYMKYGRRALIVSAALVVASLLSLIVPGLNYAVDFTGGLIVEASYSGEADLEVIRSDLAAAGFESAQVQSYASTSDVLIRLPPLSEEQDTADARDQLLRILQTRDPMITIRRFESVGSQVGEDLAEQGGLAMLIAGIMIFFYVMVRFRWKLALSALAATIHDVIVTTGIFTLFGLSFDLTALGALLAVLGYSLNDKIVVFDRLRDNFRSVRRGTVESIINVSINQVLSRTLVTGVTTLLVLVALLIFAGDTLRGFSIALFAGILIGTYSSIFVGCTLAMLMNIAPLDFAEHKRERSDDLP